MFKLLMGTAIAVALAAPANAANTALIMWNAADPLGFESASGTGTAALASQNFDGVTVTLSFVNRNTTPNGLTEGNINIDNTTGTTQTLRIIAGANGFLGHDSVWNLTGTIGATLGQSDLSGDFFVDSTNSLNGLNELVTGNSIGLFDSGSLAGPKSFSFNGTGFDSVFGPYGLAESLTLTLQPGASVFVQGMSMEASAVPEPSQWAMLISGFGLMGLMGLKRATKNRLAA